METTVDETTNTPAPELPSAREKDLRAQRNSADARARRAVSMRVMGATYAQIAEACGYKDHSGARLAVERGLDLEYPKEDAERLRTTELALAVQVRRGLLPAALRGDPQSAVAALRYSERIARLTGIDAPTRVTVRPEQVEEFLTLVADLGLDGTYTVTDLEETG